MIEPAYRYRASLGEKGRVIDGDTYILDVDLGFHVHAYIEIRLHGWSCPELGSPEGDLARTAAAAAIAAGPIVVESFRDRRSFARWVADVYIGGEHLGARLEAAGLALPGARVG